MRVLLIFFTVLFLTGCSKEITAEDMPAVVFAESMSRGRLYKDESSLPEDVPMYETMFIDNKGDIYFLANDYLSEYNLKMISEYEEGKLKDKLKLIGKCDVEQVLQNYKRLLSVKKNKDFRLIRPEIVFKEVTEDVSVKGIYRDDEETKVIELYSYLDATPGEPSDKVAEKILSWFRDVMKEAREKK